ncbi:hypothetical protein [Cystobacter ferrugineus]|uniref:Uncharacterized protein n=1 Tax=Cystobacter ferrugineus TaxID=83449 RepID=A0A1L9B1E1_9BACT|nr:hypothetical protein [Cystobacter ferrugineus]OJH36061.1 hypothetical protein BON30_36330 [Cystobacter ferrugineus]
MIEAKRRLRTDGSWAAQILGNLLAHGQPPPADLLAIIVPDRLYIWRSSDPPHAPPAYEIDTRPLLAPYFERIGVRPEQIQPMAFEALVSWWLNDLARGDVAPVTQELSKSGLLDAVSGAQIIHENPA